MNRYVLITALILFIMAACNRTEDISVKSIEGTYNGFLTTGGEINLLAVPAKVSATAEVVSMSNGQVEVHCYGDILDTTFLLNYYENGDSIMVCLTGDDFENMYGHMLGQGHMAGGMMGDIANNETQWEHHMNDEHHIGDEHFGGFDMMDHTFGYRFKITEGDSTYYMKFVGKKQ
jgi:hypothetical protein